MTRHTSPGRDTRIDVIRAIALISIFINHVPGNPLELLTHKNLGFSDAAEAFVLISGISAGFAYGLKFQPGKRLVTALKTWRRAGVLYIAQLGTTMATLGVFAFFALRSSRPELLEMINIGPVVTDTAAALVGIVTFGHQLGYNNILSMYAVVLVMLPVFLLIGTVSLRLMLAASGGLWLVAGLLQIAPPNFPDEGVWFLNPLSWQFLFVIGIAATMHVRRGGRLPSSPWLVIAAISYVMLSFLWVRLPLWSLDASFGLPAVVSGFDKTYLSLPRLLHVLAIAYLVGTLPALSGLARTSQGHPLAVLGRHSLPVFVTGTILSMGAQAWREVNAHSAMTDVVIVAGGIMAQFALAYYLDWYGRIVRGAAPQASRSRPELIGPPARAGWKGLPASMNSRPA